MLNERKKQLRQLDQQIAALNDLLDRATLKAVLERKIDNWHDVIGTKHPNQARLILQ